MFTIRKAVMSDLTSIKSLANMNRESLGFVVRGALLCGIEKQWLLIAVTQDRIIGFAHYRHRRDTQSTLYELCVVARWRRQGIGRVLIASLLAEMQERGKTYLQLKTPIDLPANDFYQHIGFTLMGQESGRKRPLNVWRINA